METGELYITKGKKQQGTRGERKMNYCPVCDKPLYEMNRMRFVPYIVVELTNSRNGVI